MSVPYVVVLSRDAEQSLDRVSDKMAFAVEAALDDLSRERLASSHVKKLRGQAGRYRKRVGDFRVLFEIDDDQEQVFVFHIADRKDAY